MGCLVRQNPFRNHNSHTPPRTQKAYAPFDKQNLAFLGFPAPKFIMLQDVRLVVLCSKWRIRKNNIKRAFIDGWSVLIKSLTRPNFLIDLCNLQGVSLIVARVSIAVNHHVHLAGSGSSRLPVDSYEGRSR